MQKTKFLNIVLASIIVLLLVMGENGTSPADKFKKFFQSEHKIEAANNNYTKRSFGEKEVVFPKPAMVIGSYDESGTPNIMTCSWFGIVNSRPLKVSVSLRPATYSYNSITANKAFTVNIPDASHVGYVNFMGTHSGRDINKFEVTGLTPIKSEFVNAPYIKEFPIILECKVVEIHDLGSHRQFIGQVIDAKIDEQILDTNGKVDLNLFTPLLLGDWKDNNFNYYKGGEFIKNLEELMPKVE